MSKAVKLRLDRRTGTSGVRPRDLATATKTRADEAEESRQMVLDLLVCRNTFSPG